VNLALKCSKDVKNVIIFEIIEQNDEFNNKVTEVNSFLEKECKNRNIPIIGLLGLPALPAESYKFILVRSSVRSSVTNFSRNWLISFFSFFA